jgi:parallel beta-helix repeat protein
VISRLPRSVGECVRQSARLVIVCCGIVALTTSCNPVRGPTVRLRPTQDVVAIVAARPAGTTFEFMPGTYRLTGTIVPRSGDRLVGRPGAILSGALVITGWSHPRPSVWIARVPDLHLRGNGGAPGQALAQPQTRYHNNVFVDGRMLWKAGVMLNGQLIGEPASSLPPNGYFVDYDRRTIALGSDPHGHRVELANAPTLIQSQAGGVTVEGLTVERSAARGISALGPGWRIERNTSRQNATNGVTTLDFAKVDGNLIIGNGVYGITGRGEGIAVTGNTVARNDASGVGPLQGGCNDAGGSKWVRTRDLVVTGNVFRNNQCNGIWLDIDNYGSLVANNRSVHNAGSGIVHEISYAAGILDNTVEANGGFGILVRSSPNDQITGNVVVDNSRGGILLLDGRRDDHPSSFGTHQTRSTVVENNVIRVRAGAMAAGIVGAYAGSITTSDRFDHNVYLLPQLWSPAFRLGRPIDATAWQASGEDVESRFQTAQGSAKGTQPATTG